LEIEVSLLRSEAERRPHVSLAVHEGVTRDNERLKSELEFLKNEVDFLRSEAERHVADYEGVERDNERLKSEFELLKNESMNLIALLGTLESADPEAIPGCSD
jgi:hypothetical protein